MHRTAKHYPPKEAARIRLAELRTASSQAKTTQENRTAALSTDSGEVLYRSMQETLERDHLGAYVIINTETAEYVIGSTTSEVHTEFIDQFGEDAPGWCTRIGASVFATT